MSSGQFSVGDLIGSLRAGKMRKEDLREIAKRLKLHPELARKAGDDMAGALPEDPFDKKFERINDDYELVKRAFEDVDCQDVADEIGKRVRKGIFRKAVKWGIRKILDDGELPNNDALEKIRDMAANGTEEEKELAEHAIEELKAHGISVN